MLIPDDADELLKLETRYRVSRNDRSHFALTIVTSLGCNFDCPYCFEAKHPSIMNEQIQEMVLQVLNDQLPRIQSFHVTWFGGEPLAGKKSLLALSDAFIARCNAYDVSYDADIVTNGYLLDEETCNQLHSRSVHRAQVSLDGPPAVHDRMRPLANGKGSFHKILANLHHAIEYLSVTVRVNLDTGNIDSVEELFGILADEGFAGRLSVYPGQIVGVTGDVLAPSARYHGCFPNPECVSAKGSFTSS
jgi:uncharacterized protein